MISWMITPILVLVMMYPTFIVLRTKLDDDLSLILSFPISIVILSSLVYYLGLILGSFKWAILFAYLLNFAIVGILLRGRLNGKKTNSNSSGTQ